MSTNQQTLAELLQQRVTTFAQSDRPAEIIDEYTEKMFATVIKEQFEWRGDMYKLVSEAVKEALPGQIDESFELTRYTALIENAFRSYWDASGLSEDLVAQAQSTMENVLKEFEMPKVVSLRELLHSFVEHHEEDAMSENWEKPNIQFNQSDNDNFIHIYFDKAEEDTSTNRFSSLSNKKSCYSLDNNLAVHLDKERDESDNFVGEVYAAKLDGNVIGRVHTPYRDKFEKLIVGLYYGKAKLCIDCDEDEFYYPGHD